MMSQFGEMPGPIDNWDLIGEYEGDLKKNLLKNHDFIIVCESIWNHLYDVYGCNKIFKRMRYYDENTRKFWYDLYPPILYGY